MCSRDNSSNGRVVGGCGGQYSLTWLVQVSWVGWDCELDALSRGMYVLVYHKW